MVSPRVDPVGRALPCRSKPMSVVIGGGIIGASTALDLGGTRACRWRSARRGRIGGEQSSRNWGWCRRMGRDPPRSRWRSKVLRLWERHERAHRRRERLPPDRHRLSLRERAGSGEARSMARSGEAVPDRFRA